MLAPTDEAFAKLPEGTVETLLKPENKEKLVAILKYHVIPGKALAADVDQARRPGRQDRPGEKAKIAVKDGTVMSTTPRSSRPTSNAPTA